MRHVIVALTLIISALCIGFGTPAHAGEVCHTETETYTDANGNIVTVVKEVCVDTGETGNAGNGDSGCSYDGKQIPCTKFGATWFASQSCYASNVSETYPADQYAEYWQGHTGGSLWMCNGYGPDMIDVGSPNFFWLPTGAAPVDPAVLAQQALDRMPLAAPQIHMAPQPPLMTYVGLETWLWMNGGQWANLAGGASAGGTSVSVVARPVKVTWDLTVGSTTCTSAGRPWVHGMSSSAQTDCSYTFQKVSDFQPGDEFPVTATIKYLVDWTCAGACSTGSGSLGQVDGPTSSSAIRVGERQSVVVH
jgi:hypothetical protein